MEEANFGSGYVFSETYMDTLEHLKLLWIFVRVQSILFGTNYLGVLGQGSVLLQMVTDALYGKHPLLSQWLRIQNSLIKINPTQIISVFKYRKFHEYQFRDSLEDRLCTKNENETN